MREIKPLIHPSQIISVINKMLCLVDARLVGHGERVAYIVLELLAHSEAALPLDSDKLLVLSILHDIGAYKTDEIDEMISFDSKYAWSHAVYGYLFLKYMSPLGAEAEAILYHHLDYKDYDKTTSAYLDYASLIHLADRIDILSAASTGVCDFSRIMKNSGTQFDPKHVDLFFHSEPERIVENLRNGSYHDRVADSVALLSLSTEEAIEYLKMMVSSVDFRSEYTVTHTMNTTAISVELARRFGLPADELQKVYLGALLHDVGKIAIPPDILEFQGRLTPDQMEIMKQHVCYSREIIEGVVDDEIVRLAVRHHEKLDGSGYPLGLTEEQLTPAEQIVAVADIVSALTSKRSYKDAFPKQKTLNILKEMMEAGQLSPWACRTMAKDFDEIMAVTSESRDPVLKLYQEMHTEYFELNGKIKKLVEESR